MTLLSYRRTRSSEASKQASVEGGTGIQSQMNLSRPPPSFQHVRPTEMLFPRKRREFPQQNSQKENTNRAPTLHFGISRERVDSIGEEGERSEWSGVGSERTHNKPGQGRRASVASMALSIIDRSLDGISSRVRIQNTHTHTHTHVFSWFYNPPESYELDNE